MNRREVKRAPVLRFKGFTNDWEQRTLKKLGFFYKGKGYTKKDLINNGVPILLYGELYTHYSEKISNTRLHSKLLLHSIFSAGNEVVLPDSGETSTDIARASWISNSGIILAGGLIIIKPNEYIFPGFLAYSLTYGENHKLLASRAQGKSIVHIHVNDLKTLNIIYPENLKEQQRIFALLEKLNKCIALQQRKLELLKLFKIGMLQNILADTKAASKLKFKGSNQEWRPRRLNSITNIITKGTTPHFKQASNGVNFIKIEDISKDNGKIYPRSFITEKENNGYLKRSQLKAGDLLFSIAGTLGRVGKVTDDILPANTNQALAIIRLKPSQNIDFCKIMLESDSVKRYIHANPTMGAQPNLSLKQISDLTLFFPDIKEQTLISQLIKKIDNLLALQYQNISKFKQLKQFLLQNIFI